MISSNSKSEMEKRLAELTDELVKTRRKLSVAEKAQQEFEAELDRHTSALAKTNELLKKEIYDRMLMEKRLRNSEDKYRNLVENMNDVIYALDQNGGITYISPAIEGILHYSPTELIGMPFQLLLHQEDSPETEAFSTDVLTRGTVQKRFRLVAKTGETRWVRTSGKPVISDGKVLGIQGVLTDITKSKSLEDRLIRSERLAATGQLAVSIAHEINSPLQAIVVLLNTLSDEYADDDYLSQNIDILTRAFQSIRDTVKSLLDLNRPDRGSKQYVNVNPIIRQTVGLTQSYLKECKVDVEFDLAADIPDILIAPQQMSQVLLNMITNAVEAMTRLAPSKDSDAESREDEKKITFKTESKDGFVIIRIADTGSGIEEEDLDHIFDPFYTRKKTMGMGVGLSICHGIIEDHDGSVVAENVPSGGTVFTITMPVDKNKKQTESASRPDPSSGPSAHYPSN